MELPAAVPGENVAGTAGGQTRKSDIPPLPAGDAYFRIQGTSIHGWGLLEDSSTGLTLNREKVTANEVELD